MTLIQGLKATNYWKAFIVNAIASSVIIVLSITLKQVLDKYTYRKNNSSSPSPSSSNNDDKENNFNPLTWESITITFIVTFISTYCSYWLLFWLFGFGGGMIVTTNPN